MKLTALCSLALVSAAAAVDVRYDTNYDSASGSMNTVACSNGANGLASRYPTFGSLPTFPNIGAAQAIAGWNSTACGSCWRITYKGKSILVTAIDHAGDGFNLALPAMNTLTNGQAVQLGVISGATATQVASSQCGIH